MLIETHCIEFHIYSRFKRVSLFGIQMFRLRKLYGLGIVSSVFLPKYDVLKDISKEFLKNNEKVA